MKVHRMLGSFAVAFGVVVPQAYAQADERVAALDPAVAPAEPATPPPVEASTPESPSAPAAEPVTAPAAAAETAPAPAVAAPPPAPRVAEAAPLTLGFASGPKDAPAPATSDVPIRSRRKLALLGEVGWNGLAGWGLVMTYNLHPHVAFDLAGGLSLTGWKAGLRGRYNLLTGPFTPFVGAGLSMSSGLDGARLGGDRKRSDDDRDFDFDPNEEGKYDVKRSEFAQAVIGFEFIHRHGFTMQASAGYSWLLNRNNFTFVAGKRDDDLAKALFGSGPVVSTAFGYAFD